MIKSLLTGIVALTGLIIIWQIAVTATGVPRFILPAPGLGFQAFIANSGLIVEHAIVTLTEVVLGLIIGILLGI